MQPPYFQSCDQKVLPLKNELRPTWNWKVVVTTNGINVLTLAFLSLVVHQDRVFFPLYHCFKQMILGGSAGWDLEKL